MVSTESLILSAPVRVGAKDVRFICPLHLIVGLKSDHLFIVLHAFICIDFSLNILMLSALSITLEYCRDSIFQSIPVFIIAANS